MGWHKAISYITAFSSLMGVGACGNSTSQRDNLASQNAALGSNRLQGRWSSGCESEPGASQSLKATMIFTSDQVKSTISIYSDLYCRAILERHRFEGTYKLGTLAGASSDTVAIDYRVNREVVTFYDQDAVNSANQSSNDNSNCHFDDWKVGVPKDVSSQEPCLHQYWIGQRRYSVIRVEGKRLYMGKGPENGDSPDARSTELSDHPLSRK